MLLRSFLAAFLFAMAAKPVMAQYDTGAVGSRIVTITGDISSASQLASQRLTAIDGAQFDQFGYSVAVKGDIVVVGAPIDDQGIGSAFVFQKQSDGTFSETVLGVGEEVGDQFGWSVAMDGDLIVVGMPFHNSFSGAAYVFQKQTDGSFTSEKIVANAGEAEDGFGFSVAVYSDTVVVGAIGDDSGRGSAYVFQKNAGGAFSQVAKLDASDRAESDNFGLSVAAHGDLIVVGAPTPNDDNAVGAAYVFQRQNNGGFVEVGKLTANDGAADDEFGYAVAVYGGTIVVGSYKDDDKGADSGSAYVFHNNAGSSYTQVAKLVASDGAAGDQFGSSIAIYGDTIVLGALEDDGMTGSAYIFQKSESTFTQISKLLADGSVYLGVSVAVHGNTIVVGAVGDGGFAGSAYVFYNQI